MVSLVLAYIFLLAFPLSEDLRLSRFADIAQFYLYNLTAAVPFFFAGTVVGLIITFNAERVNTVYFSDLLGAGLGCLLCPFFLWKYGAGGSFVFLTLLALAGAVI
ncbi:MAG: hypothetical protein Kow0099_28200 [Candidatus Abyssubacteria bacterium]